LSQNQIFRAAYASCHNGFRIHLSLGKDALTQRLGQLVARPILGGLQYICCRV